jgi:7,8-dihydro-6-hydroxymethylpterin-pyrophosphokinase
VLKEKTFVLIPLIHTTKNLYKSAHQKRMAQNTIQENSQFGKQV